MKRIVFIFPLLMLVLTSYSQLNQEDIPICGTSIKQQELFENNPHLEELYQNNQLYQNNPVNTEQKLDSTLHIIPVVFHILHEYGIENISDEQVYDALRVLNEEFGGYDDDSVNIIPHFKGLNANTFIEFRLAAIDPDGNCTNGIEHIYSHETRNGDDYSKVHQWDRSKYMNIWVATNASSTAAYAYYPMTTNGNNFWLDGIMANHSYVGSIGTSSPVKESKLTHETGHYLGLQHLFGSAGATVCGDDGIADTPMTKGWFLCETDTNALKDCDPNIVEDVNNYMEFNYCTYHFTPGQGEFMQNTLQNTDGERNVLIQNSTLTATGVINATMPQSALTVPLCTPVADFNAGKKHVCLGTAVNFYDESWNAVVDSWEWQFEDGTPATSTSQNPTVTFNSTGWKDITLTVSNATGTDVVTFNDYIYVSPDWADFVGPANLEIEATQHWLFLVENPENNEPHFQAVDGVGMDGSKAFKLNNYKDVSGAVPFSDDYFYYNRLGKSQDMLISPSFNLSNTTNVTVGFWYAYASMATQLTGVDEVLKVYSSRDCGETWITRKTVQGSDLFTAGLNYTQDFIPNSNTQWNYAEFTYTTNAQDTKTRFMFEFEASDSSNNLYIDKVSIDGILSTDVTGANDLNFTVYPNPGKGEHISVQYIATGQPVIFTLTDLSGKQILSDRSETVQGEVKFELPHSAELPPACYLLHISSGSYRSVRKVVIL